MIFTASELFETGCGSVCDHAVWPSTSDSKNKLMGIESCFNQLWILINSCWVCSNADPGSVSSLWLKTTTMLTGCGETLGTDCGYKLLHLLNCIIVSASTHRDATRGKTQWATSSNAVRKKKENLGGVWRLMGSCCLAGCYVTWRADLLRRHTAKKVQNIRLASERASAQCVQSPRRLNETVLHRAGMTSKIYEATTLPNN